MKVNKVKTVGKRDSYFRFLLGRQQWADWAVIFLSTFLGLIPVLLSYPMPNTISDSFGYLSAAFKDEFVAYRPFGYSFYLQTVYRLSSSIYSIVVSHALLYGLSVGMLLLAVKKYWPPRRRAHFLIVEAVVSLSPAAIYMLNTIMSDSLFCCLIFIMVAMAIVWLQEGSWIALCIYALVLFASMHTRYSAMFFPLAFVPVFALKGSLFRRIVSIVATVAAFLVFYLGVSAQMERLTGKRQLSTGFDGWQLANNALHILPHLDQEDLAQEPQTTEMQLLHKICVSDMPAIREFTHDGKEITAQFLWNMKSPLKMYAHFCADKNEDMYYYDAWISLGSGLYKDYGIWLITRHPWLFVCHYLAPNTLEAFFPTKLEMIGHFSEVPAGKTELSQWFTDVPEEGLHARNDAYGRFVRAAVPWIDLLTWLVMLASFVLLLVKKVSLSKETKFCLLLLFLFGFIYYGTTVFASPIAARYWMPMHAIKLSFAWIAWRASIKSEE